MTQQLYPPITPFQQGFIKLDEVHTMYFEQSGNPNGVPVLFLHGGPGAGSNPKHRQFFDPEHYRIIIFDQRGCGQSTPLGELKDNTTQHLIDDVETLRQHLNIDKWHVFGGSWGSTLALTYAIQHTSRVLSLTLRGIFMMRESEIQSFLYGMRQTFPDAWDDFTAGLSTAEITDLLNTYYKKLTHPDPAVHLSAARKWSAYETACVRLIPEPPAPPSPEEDHFAYAIARIECHYFVHNRFTPDDYILANVSKIKHIPAVIVQGRYDAACPAISAFELHKKWPEAKLHIIPDAGHSSSEPGILSALITATNNFRKI